MRRWSWRGYGRIKIGLRLGKWVIGKTEMGFLPQRRRGQGGVAAAERSATELRD